MSLGTLCVLRHGCQVKRSTSLQCMQFLEKEKLLAKLHSPSIQFFFKKAFNLVQAVETAEQQVKVLQTSGNSRSNSQTVHQATQQGRKLVNQVCYCCSGVKHKATECWFKHATCGACEKFWQNWKQIFQVWSQVQLQRMLSWHKAVFQHTLSCIKGGTAKLHLKSGAQPKISQSQTCSICPLGEGERRSGAIVGGRSYWASTRVGYPNCFSDEAEWRCQDLRRLQDNFEPSHHH